jgi:hypothetical protein
VFAAAPEDLTVTPPASAGSAKALQKRSISVQADLQMLHCAVDMEPFMELSSSGSANLWEFDAEGKFVRKDSF